jgi:chromosome segregation ATPase
MTTEQIIQLYAMILASGGLVILAARMFLSGGSTANKALAVAVDSQSQVSGIMKWQMEFISTQAEQHGRSSERIVMLQEALEKERLSSLELQKQIAKNETENKAVLEKMKTSSDEQIESLKLQIEELQAEMADVQKKLEKTIEEKLLLEQEKNEAQLAVEGLQKRVDEISKETESIRKDMLTMREGYETRIKELEVQIALKDEEIVRLKQTLGGTSDEKLNDAV